MNGLKQVAMESQKVKGYNTRLTIYYDFSTDTVNSDGIGWEVTALIRPNTEDEIKRAVKRWMCS